MTSNDVCGSLELECEGLGVSVQHSWSKTETVLQLRCNSLKVQKSWSKSAKIWTVRILELEDDNLKSWSMTVADLHYSGGGGVTQ